MHGKIINIFSYSFHSYPTKFKHDSAVGENNSTTDSDNYVLSQITKNTELRMIQICLDLPQMYIYTLYMEKLRFWKSGSMWLIISGVWMWRAFPNIRELSVGTILLHSHYI